MQPDQPFSHSPLNMKDLKPKPPENLSLPGNPRRRDDNYTRRKLSRKVSHFYKNPQIFAALVQASSSSQRSFGSKLLILAPAFAFQFCVVLTFLFSVVNLRLLSISPEYASIHLIIASIINIALIAVFHKCTKNVNDDRKILSRLLVCFTSYLLLGTVLVLIANADIMSDADAYNLNATGNTTFFFPDLVKVAKTDLPSGSYVYKNVSENDTEKSSDILPNVTHLNQEIELATTWLSTNDASMSTPTLYAQNLAFVGYVIMASSLSAGQFLMARVAGCVVAAEAATNGNTMEVVVGALGGCCVCFLGALDLSSIWNQPSQNTYILIGHIVILLSIAIILLIGGTACSVITWYIDVIKEALQPEEDIEENILIGHNRRPTRTAQEIYDECAALLGRRTSVSYMEENLSPRNLPTEFEESVSDSINQSDIVADFSTRHYNRLDSKTEDSQPPIVTKSSAGTRSCRSILKSQSFTLTLVLMFLLSSSVVSVEYNAAPHLGHVFHDPKDTFQDGCRKGVMVGSAGIFMMYLVFALVKYFFEIISQKLGWKSLSLGVGLVSALVTLAFAISHDVAAFFAASCVLGLLRLAMAGLTWTTPTGSQVYATIPWCMMPLSLGVSSAVVSPLVAISGFHDAAMYYSAASSVLGCVVLLALF